MRQRNALRGLHRKHNGRYQYRRVVAPALRAYVGRREYIRSFSAANEKEALCIGAQHAQTFHDMLNQALAQRLRETLVCLLKK
jgi:hypothetical protein